MRTRAPAAPLLALALLALGGCGLGAGRTPAAVQLLVTRDFGEQQLAGGQPQVHGAETVMSLLTRNHRVSTRYGGGFVQSIDGLAGGSQVDWFYYVNGVEAPLGAAETNVHAGDRVWWDLHDWSQTEDVPAVVGSFPEPFLDGIGGQRLPVRVECARVGAYACATVTARLRSAGVPAAIAGLGPGGAPQTLRVRVGTWTQVEGDLAVQTIAQGPRASGVYARFERDGRSLELLDRDGAAVQTLAAGAGLVAATRHAEDAPVWVVTGTDDAGVRLAARAFAAATLEHRFAIALAAAGELSLPARAGAGAAP